MNFSPFPDLLLLITVVLGFGFTIFSFIRATRLTRNTSYLWLSVGFSIAFVGYLLTVLTTFFTDTDNKDTLVLTLIILVNICFVIAFILIVNSLILIREDRLPIFSHIAGILAGGALFLVVTIDLSDISYNSETKFWDAAYNMDLLIPIGIPIMIIFLTYFVLYLIRKFHKWKNDKKFDHVFLAFVLLGFWMVTIYFDQLRIVRHFVFPVAILFFGTAVFFDPLNMLVSNKLPEELILVTENNHPILRYNVLEHKVEKNLDEVKLLIAGKKVIRESINSSKKSKALILEEKEIRITAFNGFHIIAVGTKIDRNSLAAIRLSFCKLKLESDLDYLHTTLVMKDEDEKLFIEYLSENFKRIDGSRKKKNKTKH